MAKKKPSKRPTPGTGTNRKAILAREREKRAVEMRLGGATLDAIAKEVGYADPESARVAILRVMAKMTPPEKLEELRTLEIEKMNEVEREAWQQWRRSTQDAETRTEAEGKGGVFVTEKTEGQSGNPALLDKVIKASERRAKLLGLDKPQLIDVSQAPRVIGQSPIEIFDNAAKRARGEKLDAAS